MSHWGATGDGVTTDTTAFAAATAALITFPRSSLFFPAARFLVTGNLDLSGGANGPFSGQGRFASTILNHCTGGTSMFSWPQSVSPSTAQNLSFEDFGIIGQWAAEQASLLNYPINLASTSRLRFTNLFISNSDAMGIVARVCHDVTVSGCIIFECAIDGISVFGS